MKENIFQQFAGNAGIHNMSAFNDVIQPGMVFKYNQSPYFMFGHIQHSPLNLLDLPAVILNFSTAYHAENFIAAYALQCSSYFRLKDYNYDNHACLNQQIQCPRHCRKPY